MKRFAKPLRFTLALLPIAALAGWFSIQYQLRITDPAQLESLTAQLGSAEALIPIYVLQTVLYAAVCGFFGCLLAARLGLMRPLRFERLPLLRTLACGLVFGALFSLDYWTFGAWMPALRGADYGFDAVTWLASILYGGVVEETMLRLFVMSLAAWLLWKLCFRKKAAPPTGVLVAANVVAALLFAAGHLPGTAQVFGELTPLLVFRCFLLNGGFGLVFGRLYRKYGIQYAMLCHALLHVVSRTIWMIAAG